MNSCGIFSRFCAVRSRSAVKRLRLSAVRAHNGCRSKRPNRRRFHENGLDVQRLGWVFVGEMASFRNWGLMQVGNGVNPICHPIGLENLVDRIEAEAPKVTRSQQDS